jgi:RNA polymerase sigma factor (sigma-70 family)
MIDPDARIDPSLALLARWQASGDREALDQLLRIEVSTLKARVRAKGGELAHGSISVSDVAQEAVLRLLRVEPAPHFDSAEALRSYLWLSAWRLLLGRLRRPETGLVALDPAESARLDRALSVSGGQSEVEDRDRNLSLAFTVELLDESDRRVLELVYFQDLGIEGAARELGISYDAARTRIARARRNLARKLEGWTELVG